jgi:hypothetical protein
MILVIQLQNKKYAIAEKHTQLVSSLTRSLQTSRTATKIARSHVTIVLLEAFSYKLLKTWKQDSQTFKKKNKE